MYVCKPVIHRICTEVQIRTYALYNFAYQYNRVLTRCMHIYKQHTYISTYVLHTYTVQRALSRWEMKGIWRLSGNFLQLGILSYQYPLFTPPYIHIIPSRLLSPLVNVSNINLGTYCVHTVGAVHTEIPTIQCVLCVDIVHCSVCALHICGFCKQLTTCRFSLLA